MSCEEAGEFIQAVSKYERALLDHKHMLEKEPEKDQEVQKYMIKQSEEVVKLYEQKLIDEIGDMWITLMAIQSRYDDSTWADRIDERIEKKLNKKY
jgi:NTP pyrophosphatase (non-canonical NTP hydrolase)